MISVRPRSRTHKSILDPVLVILFFSMLWGACGDEEEPLQKFQAMELPSVSGSKDLCQSNRWYGDGECDDFCPKSDSDCNLELQAQADEFLESFVGSYAPVEKENALASWEYYTLGTDAASQRYNSSQLGLVAFYLDNQRRNQLQEFTNQKYALNYMSRRSIEEAVLTPYLADIPIMDLMQIINLRTAALDVILNFKTEFEGQQLTRAELLALQAQEFNSERRKRIWEALMSVGPQVAPKIKELVPLANQATQAGGFANARDFGFHVLDEDAQKIEALFDQVERLTEDSFNRMKQKLDQELADKFGIRPEDLMPWHYTGLYFEGAPFGKLELDGFYQQVDAETLIAWAKTFYGGLGFDIEDVLQRSDLYPRAGKWFSAMAVEIDRQQDVRVLLNVQPTAYWMMVTLHELGHATYSSNLDAGLPFLLRTVNHVLATEGMALLMEYQASLPQFLTEIEQQDPAQIEAVQSALLEHIWRERLIFARWSLVMFKFEKALYQDPNQDLNALWWDLVERYQHLKRPPGRDQPDWACKQHFVMVPIYYQNYLLGDLFAAQIRTAFSQQAHTAPLGFNQSVVNRQDFGQFLLEKVFRPGKKHHWWQFIQLATGKELGAEDFAREMNQSYSFIPG